MRSEPLAAPWAILPETLRDICARAGKTEGLIPPKPAAGWWDGDDDEEEDTADESDSLLTVEDGIGVIRITGPLMRNPDWIDKYLFGATGFEDIRAALKAAETRADVRAVLLDIDSPGGTVAGTPETADAIAALAKTKRVYAYTEGLMASAAYWLGSQAHAIYATKSARVGSIGVLQPIADLTALYASAGVRIDLLTTGKHKGAGYPGTATTDEQKELFQSQLDSIHADFRAAVLARGRRISDEAMQGQVFEGRAAQRENLAGTIRDRDAVLGILRQVTGISSGPGVDMKSRAMTETDLAALSTAHDELKTRVTELEAENAKLKADCDAAEKLLSDESAAALKIADMLEAAEEKAVSAINRAETLEKRNAELEAAEKDIDTRAAAKAAAIAAGMGGDAPLPLSGNTPGAGGADLLARFNACKSPAEQTAFWRSLSSAQVDALLKQSHNA